MQPLDLSMLSTSIAALLLALVLGRAAYVERERALVFWTLAIVSYLLRVVLEAPASLRGTALAAASSYVFGVASAMFLLAGVVQFRGRTPPTWPEPCGR